MSKLARSTGLATEALSQLSYAADLSGVENLGDALNKFNKNIGEAAKGSKAQADAFAAIGVSIKDVNGHLKPTEQLLNETADAFEKYADGTAKSNVAQQILGGAWAELITEQKSVVE